MVVQLVVTHFFKTASGTNILLVGVTNIPAMVKEPQCILTLQSSAPQLSLVAISHCAGGVLGSIHLLCSLHSAQFTMCSVSLCSVYTVLSLHCAQSTLYSVYSLYCAQSTVHTALSRLSNEHWPGYGAAGRKKVRHKG